MSKTESSHSKISSEKAIALLNQQIGKAIKLISSPTIEKSDYEAWELLTKNYLEKSFGMNSPNVTAITLVGKTGVFLSSASQNWWNSHRRDSIEIQISKLKGLVELLETEKNLSEPDDSEKSIHFNSKKIFIVHGRNETALHLVKDFLLKLGLEPIILRELPNEGKTIIEKFTDYSNVGFSIILLTGDDKGGLLESPPKTFQNRARQNVILELGFFLGKLGRNRVCALYQNGVEIPSDYQGVLFTSFDDNGGWKLLLAREMKAAGITLDMNKAV